ncbi:hypothetical protein A9Q81_14765 [Gammaproteobacteria bacterium 42_54_T18]|nr:hypothetical protein A9Q81_14765 [Gammaproteobacteria bacterium 42_54_T18]
MTTVNKRPITELIDLLGRKWVLRILWELNLGSCTFRELQARCGDISPTTINKRIKELCSANLVIKSKDSGYNLSPQGKELITLFEPINSFSKRWASSKN